MSGGGAVDTPGADTRSADTRGAEFLAPGTLHPSHLCRVAPTVGAPTLAAIAAHPRFAARFRALLPPALAIGAPPEPETPAERLALQPAARVAAAGVLMGAAWHARAIGRCIGSDAVGALEAAIGRDARVFGLRSAVLAVAPAETVPAALLAGRVLGDGARCLRRWRDALREPFRDLAILRLPRNAAADSAPGAAPEAADPVVAAAIAHVLDAG